MTRSMTGFAAREGAAHGWSWTWEVRGVNGRGLDLRLKLPDWPAGLEAPARAALQERLARGNVTLALRLQRDEAAGASGLHLEALDRAIAMVRRVEERALSSDLELAPSRATDLMAIRGVLETGAEEADPEPLRQAVLADLDGLIDAFDAMRAAEGAALAGVIGAQLDRIADAAAEARALVEDRARHMAETFRAALARVLDAASGIAEDRVAQELAVLAVKADVTEELDRLDAHVAAARALLAGDGPRGRKLEFLTQEFNREANTLCAKAQFAELTRAGLDLKHTIDQMREQIQNVE